MLSFTRKADMSPGVQGSGHEIRANDVNELQAALEAIAAGTQPIPLAGIAGALGEWTNDEPSIDGQRITYTPSGIVWHRDAISADWYSDINDAITAARGGIRGARPVLLSKDTDYDRTGMDAIRIYSGVSLIAESPFVSRITSTTADATMIEVGDPAAGCDSAFLHGFRMYGGNTSAVGLDARGCTRASVTNLQIDGFTDAQLWVGGNYPEYLYGWNNTFRELRITAPSNGAGIRLSGRTLSGAGVPTANRNMFDACRVKAINSAGSIAVDLQEGDTNHFIGGDYGYSGAGGLIFKLGTGAYANTFALGASEDVSNLIDCSGSWNVFLGWKFPSAGAVVIRDGAPFNMFVGCSDGVFTDENYATNRTINLGFGVLQAPGLRLGVGSGGYAVTSTRLGESYPRFRLHVDGRLQWLDPTTEVISAEIKMESYSGKRLAWSDDSLVKMPKHTYLPTADDSKRGAMLRLHGNAGVADKVYVCIKNAADAYEWKEVQFA